MELLAMGPGESQGRWPGA